MTVRLIAPHRFWQGAIPANSGDLPYRTESLALFCRIYLVLRNRLLDSGELML